VTDEVMKDLVSKHESDITLLVSSVEVQSKNIESLVSSNTEINKRLEEISKYLAKQAVFDTRLDNMDRELTESFKRVHKRIDELYETQNSSVGCKSVQLVNKDVASVTKDVSRLVKAIEQRQEDVEEIKIAVSNIPSSSTVKWFAGLIIVYAVLFGTYVNTQLKKDELNIAKQETKLEGMSK